MRYSVRLASATLILTLVLGGALPTHAADPLSPYTNSVGIKPYVAPKTEYTPPAKTQATTAAPPTAMPPSLTPVQPSNAAVAKPITTDQANAFYTGCISNNLQMAQLNPMQKDMMCACLSAGMKNSLTDQDVRLMNDVKSEVGRAAMIKMLDKVYFPCALTPIQDSVRAECEARTTKDNYGALGKQYCGCLAGRMMNYVRAVGIPNVMQTYMRTGQMGEPFDVLTNGSGYRQELVQSYLSCFNGKIPG